MVLCSINLTVQMSASNNTVDPAIFVLVSGGLLEKQWSIVAPRGAYSVRKCQNPITKVDRTNVDYIVCATKDCCIDGGECSKTLAYKLNANNCNVESQEQGTHILTLVIEDAKIRELESIPYPLNLLQDTPRFDKTQPIEVSLNRFRLPPGRAYWGISEADLAKITSCNVMCGDQPLCSFPAEWIRHRVVIVDGLYYIPIPPLEGLSLDLHYVDDTAKDLVLFREVLPCEACPQRVPALTYIFHVKKVSCKYPAKRVNLGHAVHDSVTRLYAVPKDAQNHVNLNVAPKLTVNACNHVLGNFGSEQHEILGEKCVGTTFLFHPMSVSLIYPRNQACVSSQGNFLATLGSRGCDDFTVDIDWQEQGTVDFYVEQLVAIRIRREPFFDIRPNVIVGGDTLENH